MTWQVRVKPPTGQDRRGCCTPLRRRGSSFDVARGRALFGTFKLGIGAPVGAWTADDVVLV